MSTLTKSRRLPAKYRVRASGITEIVYSVTPELIVVLPGTRWLEKRREREARLAAEVSASCYEDSLAEESCAKHDSVVARDLRARGAESEANTDWAPEAGETAARRSTIATEDAAELEMISTDDATMELPIQEEMADAEPLSWTDRMRIATTKLVRRQEFTHHD